MNEKQFSEFIEPAQYLKDAEISFVSLSEYIYDEDTINSKRPQVSF